MSKVRVYNLGSLNLKVNPLLLKEGDLIRCVNVEEDQIGALKKRPGYTTYLSSLGGRVDSLWTWQRNNGTQFWNYAAAGGSVFYSTQGTGAWTICGNGTMTSGTPIVHAISEDTMLIGDGVAATRHTTSGTSFTNTTAAPIARGLQEFQNRIYAIGTASTLFWSNAGTPTDWTNDSSSINIPGAGRLHTSFKAADRLVTTKNSGIMHRWDGFNLVDLSTKLGPSSPVSIGEVEDYRFWLNRFGVYGYGGNRPELVSNAVEKQIYNDAGEGIAGTTFDNAPGVAHQYDYYLSVGTVTDDLTDETVSNCILKYNYQINTWRDYTFANRPTAWLSYKDASGNQQLIFGDATGQCYTFGGTQTSDNGTAIETVLEFVIHGGMPETEKELPYCWFFFNPGNEAHVQVAPANTFTKGKKNWIDLGDCSDGVAEFRGQGLRSRLLFVKITESSRNNRFNFLGFSYDARPIERS